MNFEELEWERDAAGSVVDHARVMRQSNVEVAGALFYHVPSVSRGTTKLQELVRAADIPLVGAIPADRTLEALQVRPASVSSEKGVCLLVHSMAVWGAE